MEEDHQQIIAQYEELLTERDEAISHRDGAIEQLNTAVNHLDNEIQSQTEHVTTLAENHQGATDQVQKLENTVKELEEALKASQEETSVMEAKCAEMSTTHTATVQELEAMQSSMMVEIEELKEAGQGVEASLEEEMAKHRITKQELEGMQDSMLLEIEALQEASAELEEQVKKDKAALQAEVETAKHALAEGESRFMAKLESSQQAFQKKLVEVTAKTDSQRNQIDDLSKQAQEKDARMIDIEDDLEMTKMELADANANVSTANAEKEAEMMNVHAVEEQVAEKEAAIHELSHKLDKNKEAITATLESYEVMQAQVQKSSQSITVGTAMSPMRGASVDRRVSMDSRNLEADSLKFQLMDSLNARQQLVEESHEMRLELERVKEELAATKDGQASLETRSAKLEKDNEELCEKNASLLGHTNSKQKIQHVQQMKKENHDLKKEVETLRSKATNMSRKAKRCEDEMKMLATMNKIEVMEYDKEEALLSKIREEQGENGKLSKMFERLAQEVYDVANVKATVSIKPAQEGEAAPVVPPQKVLDSCLGHLQDMSSHADDQERKLRDSNMQVHIMKDKMVLMESMSTVA